MEAPIPGEAVVRNGSVGCGVLIALDILGTGVGMGATIGTRGAGDDVGLVLEVVDAVVTKEIDWSAGVDDDCLTILEAGTGNRKNSGFGGASGAKPGFSDEDNVAWDAGGILILSFAFGGLVYPGTANGAGMSDISCLNVSYTGKES